jgi:hypothetical protein
MKGPECREVNQRRRDESKARQRRKGQEGGRKMKRKEQKLTCSTTKDLNGYSQLDGS